MLETRIAFSTLITFLLCELPDARALPSSSDTEPSQSASALRDKSKLKYEIIGIVGSYVFFTAFLFLLVFTVGRRLRRSAQSSNSSLDMEMVKPAGRSTQGGFSNDTSPVSPQKQWASVVESEFKPWTSPTGDQYRYQAQNGASTSNEKAVEREKLRNQQEMERLYAAVMAHDEQKAQSLSGSDAGQISANSPHRYPPELQHLRTSGGAVSTQPLNPGPSQQTSPVEPKSPALSRASSRLTKASPLSFFQSSHSRASSAASQQQQQQQQQQQPQSKHRPRRMSIRDLPISSPMGSSDMVQSATFSEDQPLSPRLYTPGPPPPTPGSTRKSVAAKNDTPTAIHPGSPTARRTPTNINTSSSNITGNTLPFRQHHYGHDSSQQSAPATKTTFVERRESLLYPGGRGPRTGQPAVPYSPYMPNTPLTPITPGRLVTKEDRKRARKQNGLKVLAEDELVKSDQELWGDGWRR